MDLYCPSNCCRNIHTSNDNCYYYPMQSSIQQSNIEQSSEQEQIQVSFDDQMPGEVVQIPSSMTTEHVSSGTNVEISKFLIRPVQIYTYTWALGGTSTASFDPWNLYFNHTSIKKKLDNYYLLRCKLHLKFVINASPFHYGTMLAAYKPLFGLSPAPVSSSLTADAVNVAYSQLPRVYLYPQTSQGGEITLPFLYQREWLDVTQATNLTGMGRVYLRPMTALQFANAGVGVSTTIQVYAWAEDLELNGPTVKLAMQSFVDEYGSGSISGPASAIAHMSNLLSKAPVIGKFATATGMIATGVGKIAKHFGYTNVPVIQDVHSFTPHPFPQFASPEIGTSIEKLTLDPKNELTIDPCAIGIDVGDELEIKNIVSRESYITQFPWAISNAPDDILFSTAISPNYLRIESAGATSSLIQGTPLFLAQKPFRMWRGDIKLRFKFNCSMYHRGRVRISWDPVGAIGSTVDSSTEVFTKIIDIAKNTDISVNIPYMQTTAFLATQTNLVENYANDGSQVNVSGITNGVLTVRTLTDLSAPSSTSDIQVLVFVSGGDSLEFACPGPIDPTARLAAYPVQSHIENYDIEEDNTEMAIAPSITPPSIYLLYQGEAIKSFRTLFRRTTFHRFLPVSSTLLTNTAGLYVASHKIPRVLTYPGYNTSAPGVAKGLVSTGTTFGYNRVKWHVMSWISQCFLGTRGSMNWRINLSTTKDVYNLRALRTDYLTILSTSGFSSANASSGTYYSDNILANFYSGDEPGVSVTNTKTLSGLNVSVPYYAKYKFRNATSAFYLGTSEDDSYYDWFQVSYNLNPAADSNATSTYSNMGVELYAGAGTDYTPIFFMNVPTLYLYTTNPINA